MSEVKVIEPTVGRVVLFFPAHAANMGAGPLPAMVAAVHGPRCVNLAVFDANGRPLSHPPTSVTLVQPGDPVPNGGGCYCTWMPYQIGQAGKAQELQKQLAG